MGRTLRKLSAAQLRAYCAASKQPPWRALAKACARDADPQLRELTGAVSLQAALLEALAASRSGPDAVGAAAFVLRCFARRSASIVPSGVLGQGCKQDQVVAALDLLDVTAVCDALFSAAHQRRGAVFLTSDLALPPDGLPPAARTAWAFFAVVRMLGDAGCGQASLRAAFQVPGVTADHVLAKLRRVTHLGGCCQAFALAAARADAPPSDDAFAHVLLHCSDGSEWARLAERRVDDAGLAVARLHAARLAASSFPTILSESAMCMILDRGGVGAARAAALRSARCDEWMALLARMERSGCCTRADLQRCGTLEEVSARVLAHEELARNQFRRMFSDVAEQRYQSTTSRPGGLNYAYLFHKLASLLRKPDGLR